MKQEAAVAKVKETRINWSDTEWRQWEDALTIEASPRLTGKTFYKDVAQAAMKHMQRPRPLVTGLIVQAGKTVARLRSLKEAPVPAKEQPAPEIKKEPPTEIPTAVKPVKVETVITAPTLSEPQPAAALIPDTSEFIEPEPDWGQRVAQGLSRIVIEAIVQATESPAVRKAVRSLVQVATDSKFTPEIDNTVPWVKPAFGPKFPRVLVVGSPRGSFVSIMAEEFGRRLDLRFWRTDDSYHQLRQDVRAAEIVVILASYTNHTVRQICTSQQPKRIITLPLAASSSKMKQILETLSNEHKGSPA